MDEFAKLFLRGNCAEAMRRYLRILRTVALVGAVFVLVAAILSWQETLPLWLTAMFSVAGFATEGAANALDLMKPRRLGGLAFAQNEENSLERAGRERERHEAVYRAYRESFSGFSSGKRLWILGTMRLLISAALAVSCLLVSAGIVVSDVILFSIALSAVLAGCCGVYDTVLESRARANFYRLAEREIDEIKAEELHISPERAAREAETARSASSIPEPIELFLKEDSERRDFRAVSRRGTVTGLFLGVLYFLVLAGMIAVGEAVGELGAGISWSIVLTVFAVVFVLSFVLIFSLSRRQKEIFIRNAAKLGGSEADSLRAQLQGMWLRSQRAGNIMFGCFTAGAILLGGTLGLLAYFTNSDGMPVSECLATGILPVLVYAAIVSLIVWIVMYAAAKRKMRPVIGQLRERMQEERNEGSGE